jgi:hypothetical protein
MTALRTHQDHLDSIGLGKLTENQMKAVVELVKARRMLNAPPPNDAEGNGIVIAAGGKYADWGYVNARWLRTQGIQLPIQIWHLGAKEYPDWSRKAFAKLDVEFVDAHKVRETHRHRKLEGWTVKHYAAAHAPFRNVVFYDADCFAAIDPGEVFNDPEYQDTGALFFSDIKPCRSSTWAYVFAGVRIPDHEMDSGCFFWDRVKAWEGIKFTKWLGEHSEVWDRHIYGDKDRPYLGFGTTKTPFIQSMEREWEGYGIKQSWKGRVIARHAMAYKRGEFNAPHPSIPGFFEEYRTFRT